MEVRELSNNYVQLENLTASQGFAVSGATYDYLGFYVGSACDFNHDGISDILIGAVMMSGSQARAYVIYGRNDSFASFHTANMTEEQGFAIYFPANPHSSGFDVKCVGDINQDGVADIILTASLNINRQSGEGQVIGIYGKPGGYSSIFVANMTSDQGFIISGIPYFESNYLRIPVSAAGDFNQDGIQDFMFGLPLFNSAGRTYVIYGKSGFRSSFSLNGTGLPSDQGFFIDGAFSNGALGVGVGFAGDINHDGISDILVGAPMEPSPTGQTLAGRTYVIYGKPGGYSSPLFLQNFTSDQGFVIYGGGLAVTSGYHVSSIGDFNSDGISDIFVALPTVNSGFVLYGKSGGYSSVDIGPFFDTENPNSDQGFIIRNTSSDNGSKIGIFISSGDFNQDGISDLLLGAPLKNSQTGIVYMVYGKQGGYSSSIDITSISPDQGLIFNGMNSALTGISVSAVGDFNNDGVTDFIIGSPGATVSSGQYAGKAYIIYGVRSSTAVVSPSPGISVSSQPTPTTSSSPPTPSSSHYPSITHSKSVSISTSISPSPSISHSPSSTTSPSPTPLRNVTGSACPFRVFNGMDMMCSSELGKYVGTPQRVPACSNPTD